MKVFVLLLAILCVLAQTQARDLSTKMRGRLCTMVNCFVAPCLFSKCDIPGATCR